MSSGAAGPLFQNAFYIGNAFNGILYGVELVLYFLTMNCLRRGYKRRRNIFFMLFSTMLLFCITVFVATQFILGQEMWVIHQDWPGGASAYFLKYTSAWYQTWGTMSCIVLQLMNDALWIYRLWTVWGGNWKIIIFPSILWVGTLAMGTLVMYATATPNTNFFAGFAVLMGIVYFSLTIGLNVFVTCTFCVRIIYSGLTIRKGLGEEFAATYFTVASLIIESALPYTLCGIAFIVAYGMQSETAVLFMSLYAMLNGISPQLIILRVAEGKAWTKETATKTQRLTTVAFAQGELPTSQFQSSSGTSGATVLECEGEEKDHSHDLDQSQSKELSPEKLV